MSFGSRLALVVVITIAAMQSGRAARLQPMITMLMGRMATTAMTATAGRRHVYLLLLAEYLGLHGPQ